ncbi:tape measure protein [Mannheimia sp. HC-2023]|uniref:tape measure protein n=1 Tax=Mannheimia indoligenes TaxID=3103145 RepID=UPI002FE625FD
MADLATLAIKIETEGANRASADLSKVEQSAKNTEKAADNLTRAMGNLKRILAIAGLAGGLSAYLDMAERMQSLNAQLKFVTNSQYEFNTAQKELFAIAQKTRASFESTTQLYIKSSQALKDYGYAQKDILTFTETINKAMAVGGVKPQEQASALLQLSQALGSGKLQGDEFRSISEAAPIILDTIAEYMGRSRDEVRKLASEGKLTADLLFNAFNGSSAKITEKFNQMPLTFGGAMQQLQNATLKFIGDLDKANGLSGMLAQGISFVAMNFEILAKAVMYATGAYVAFNAVAFAQNFSKAAGGVGILSSAFSYLTTMIRGATVAMMANPIGLLTVAIAGAAFAFDAFIADMQVGAETMDATWGDVANTMWSDFKDLAGEAADWISDKWSGATDYVASLFGDLGIDIGNVWATVQDVTKGVVNSIIGLYVGAYKTVVLAWDNLPASFELLGKSAVIALVDMIEKGINKVIELIKMPIDLISKASKAFGGEGFDTSGWKVNLGDFKPKLSKEAQNLGQSISQAFADSITTDYVGEALNSVNSYIDDAALRGREKRKLEEGTAESQVNGSATPKALSETGNNKNGKGSKGNSKNDWLSYISELERANADGLAKIALEQERSMREMLEKAKKAGASHTEIEKAKMLITERYAKERMEIAEKYVPSLKFEKELKDQIKEIDELQKLNLITTEQAGLAKEALAGKYQPVVEIQQQYINQLREIEALKQAGVLSEPQAVVATEKAKWDNGTQKAKIAGENAVSPYEKWKAEFDPMQAIQNEQASKLAEVQSMYDQHLIQYEDFVNAKAQIDAKATADTHQLFMNSISGFGSAIDTMLGVMKNAGQEQSGIYRTMFAMSKAFAIADSIIKIQQGIAGAAALPFPQNIGAMATVASETANIISNIQSVSLGGMAHSGIDNVPKEGTWLLDKGERVVDSRTNQDLKTFLSNANRGGASGQRSAINVKIINNGQPVEAKVSSEETVDGNIQMTVELLKKMDQIADQRYRRNQLNDLRTGGALSK